MPMTGSRKPHPLVLEVLRQTAQLTKGKPTQSIGVGDLRLHRDSARTGAAVALAVLNGWLSVRGAPAHGISITAEGRKQLEP